MDTVPEIPVLRYWKYLNIEINKKVEIWTQSLKYRYLGIGSIETLKSIKKLDMDTVSEIPVLRYWKY